jgi:hypothetical protein
MHQTKRKKNKIKCVGHEAAQATFQTEIKM